MTLAETTAILGPPNDWVRFSYGTMPQVVNVDFRDGKVDHVNEQPRWPGRVKQGTTEDQVVAVMGKPDWVTREYKYGSATLCAYGFEQERLAQVYCRDDSQLDRRFNAIPLGSSRKTVEHYFGSAIAEEEPSPGILREEAVLQHGTPLKVCASYGPGGSPGWNFCYDERSILVVQYPEPRLMIP
jgi:hypothetical protein